MLDIGELYTGGLSAFDIMEGVHSTRAGAESADITRCNIITLLGFQRNHFQEGKCCVRSRCGREAHLVPSRSDSVQIKYFLIDKGIPYLLPDPLDCPYFGVK